MDTRQARRIGAADDPHPAVLEPVALLVREPGRDLGAPRTLTSRVLDLEHDAAGRPVVVVAAPDLEDGPTLGSEVLLQWTRPRGRRECPVAVRPARRRYGRVWLLCPTAAPLRRQDRAYVRAALTMPGLLTWTAPRLDPELGDLEGSEVIEAAGVVADLSEGGALLLLRAPLPPVGTPVHTVLRLDGHDLAQPAHVVRHAHFEGVGTSTGVGVAFDDPRRHGDLIRRAVFAWERRRLRP